MKIGFMVKIKAEKGNGMCWGTGNSYYLIIKSSLIRSYLKVMREVRLGNVLKISVPGREISKCEALRENHA